jgi:hypothetical protein
MALRRDFRGWAGSLPTRVGEHTKLILEPIPADAVEERFDKPFLRSSKQQSEPGDVALNGFASGWPP